LDGIKPKKFFNCKDLSHVFEHAGANSLTVYFRTKELFGRQNRLLKSFWNWNDILLFLVSAITLNQEIVAVYKGGIKSLEMDLNSTVDISSVSDFDPREFYTYESWLQWIRVSYCLLCLHISMKVLNVA
jgi:hypothetical protein